MSFYQIIKKVGFIYLFIFCIFFLKKTLVVVFNNIQKKLITDIAKKPANISLKERLENVQKKLQTFDNQKLSFKGEQYLEINITYNTDKSKKKNFTDVVGTKKAAIEDEQGMYQCQGCPRRINRRQTYTFPCDHVYCLKCIIDRSPEDLYHCAICSCKSLDDMKTLKFAFKFKICSLFCVCLSCFIVCNNQQKKTNSATFGGPEI